MDAVLTKNPYPDSPWWRVKVARVSDGAVEWWKTQAPTHALAVVRLKGVLDASRLRVLATDE